MDPKISKKLILKKIFILSQALINKNITLQNFVLAMINDEPLSVALIARLLGTHRQTVQYAANQLIKKGLCIRRTNDYHRQAKLLVITELGREKNIFEQQAALLTYNMTPARLAESTDLLETLASR